MATKLIKQLKREVEIAGQAYIVTLDPAGIKLTAKGHRKGIRLEWAALVDGSEALAVGLNASLKEPA